MIFEVFDQKMSEKNLKNMLGGPGGPPPGSLRVKLDHRARKVLNQGLNHAVRDLTPPPFRSERGEKKRKKTQIFTTSTK